LGRPGARVGAGEGGPAPELGPGAVVDGAQRRTGLGRV
jgi:hypothetical protein